jgi:hypothetical protein
VDDGAEGLRQHCGQSALDEVGLRPTSAGSEYTGLKAVMTSVSTLPALMSATSSRMPARLEGSEEDGTKRTVLPTLPSATLMA